MLVDPGCPYEEELDRLLGALESLVCVPLLSPARCRHQGKQARHEVPVAIDYLGFDIPDVWVVGYGLDFEDRFRTLPYIGTITPTD